MSSRFKVRTYCSSSSCEYVRKEDVVQAINYESAYGLALQYNEAPAKPECPICGEQMAFYSYTLIDDPWLPRH
ncbi:hypothetical protein GK047_10870 [Paenibacillus sp. SYP-B3998]|uniref:Uncharacterized protein n=1 Tax=Paenibacillus sp. SYP-B3998 TaxID=2678564 RepID=A0A6G3ZWC7_9BACL|nr:hypothetical protein [Paenibacillus sp. SYP-B3998]NEW06513.1 hypothetical protein [Paenibacillus sp. SYP-B3998]